MSGPNFTFSTDIPQASQKISATQQPIDNNFSSINELFNVNHVGLYDPNNYGKHTYTSFPIQGSDATTTSTQMAIYAKSSTDANGAELFFRYPSNGTVLQLTGGGVTGGSGGSGYSYITNSLLLKWGQASVNTTGSTVITFPTAGGIPAFTSGPQTINYTPAANYTMTASSAWIDTLTTTTFTFHAPASGTFCNSIYWYAIGV